MKKYIIALCVLAGSVIANAQRTETLLGNWKPKNKIKSVGFYIAPELGVGNFGHNIQPIGGMSAMALLNKKWAIGITSLGSRGHENEGSSAYFGGLKLEYILRPNRLVHFSFPFVVGMAGSFNRSNDHFNNRFQGGGSQHGHYGNNSGRGSFGGSSYMLVQPGLQAELNLFKYGKVFVAGNYRYAFGEDHDDGNSYSGLSAKKLSGFGMNVGMKLGIFDYKIGKKSNYRNNGRSNREYRRNDHRRDDYRIEYRRNNNQRDYRRDYN